jgi:putative pyruvate formate lyase activating enzyme
MGILSFSDLHLSAIAIHRGEEPIIGGENGVCNLFFSGCNLQCIYCQNFQISRRCVRNAVMSASDAISKITAILETGVNTVGFVSPSHHVSETKFLIQAIHQRGFNPRIVYNTNGFDSVKTIQSLEGLVDVYLPDFKYGSNDLAFALSGVKNYVEVALRAIKQMYFHKGNTVMLDDEDTAISGLVIRHLVLPGMVDNSIKVLELIAEELSPNVSISLMSQYNPIPEMTRHPLLSRTITEDEYQQVVDAFYRLGFSKGWLQQLDSNNCFNPDFSQTDPFREEFLNRGLDI